MTADECDSHGPSVARPLLSPAVIYLIGVPAVGKYTIASNVTRYMEKFAVLRLTHPNALDLDTSEEAAESLARRVIDHIQKVQGRDAEPPNPALPPAARRAAAGERQLVTGATMTTHRIVVGYREVGVGDGRS